MTDILVRGIPIPTPRPGVLQYSPEPPTIVEVIPMPDLPEMPVVNTEGVMEYLKGILMEHSNLFEFSEKLAKIGEWGLTYLVIGACFLVFAIPIAYVITKIVRKIWP